MTIEAGQQAPDFDLPTTDGGRIRLAELAGRPLVLYFYPKDDTPGCTKEACTFQETLPRFDTTKAVVLGVSVLGTDSKAKFAKKYGLTFPLLADEDHAVADAYGAWQQKSMYGRKYMGVDRSSFLFDEKGVLVREWRSVKIKGHVAEVLAALKAATA